MIHARRGKKIHYLCVVGDGTWMGEQREKGTESGWMIRRCANDPATNGNDNSTHQKCIILSHAEVQ